jgi:hypothetical protein
MTTQMTIDGSEDYQESSTNVVKRLCERYDVSNWKDLADTFLHEVPGFHHLSEENKAIIRFGMHKAPEMCRRYQEREASAK